MDKWIGDNPKATAYILYLSVVVVLVSLIALYYFRKAHAARSELIKMTAQKSKVKKAAPLPGQEQENDEVPDVKEKDGFTIIDSD